jgi:hypothetical protein
VPLSSQSQQVDGRYPDLPEPVRKALKDAEDRAAEAERLAKAERDTRLDAEYVAKARNWKIGEAEELGKALRKVADVDSESAKVIEKAFKAAAEQVATASALFKEFGHNSAAPDSAEGRLESLAKARAAEKGESFAKAYDEVLRTEEGKALYKQMNNERVTR